MSDVGSAKFKKIHETSTFTYVYNVHACTLSVCAMLVIWVAVMGFIQTNIHLYAHTFPRYFNIIWKLPKQNPLKFAHRATLVLKKNSIFCWENFFLLSENYTYPGSSYINKGRDSMNLPPPLSTPLHRLIWYDVTTYILFQLYILTVLTLFFLNT